MMVRNIARPLVQQPNRTCQTSYVLSGMHSLRVCLLLLAFVCVRVNVFLFFFIPLAFDGGIWYHRHHRIAYTLVVHSCVRVYAFVCVAVAQRSLLTLLRRPYPSLSTATLNIEFGACAACTASFSQAPKKRFAAQHTNENVFPNTKLLFSKLLVLTKHPTETGYCVASFRHAIVLCEFIPTFFLLFPLLCTIFLNILIFFVRLVWRECCRSVVPCITYTLQCLSFLRALSLSAPVSLVGVVLCAAALRMFRDYFCLPS